MAAYLVHQGVADDLAEIWWYVAEAATVETASKLEAEFFSAFALLATHPHIGFHHEALAPSSIRFWVLRRYLIAYAVEQEQVVILAIIHGQRHPRTVNRILRARR